MKRRCYALAAWLAAALSATACGPPSGALFTPLPPRSEALGYFPSSARALLLARTDIGDRETAALLSALPGRTRSQIDGFASAHGLRLEQLRPLLGNDLVVGVPRPGAPPLAVLVTGEAEILELLAQSRVAGGRATPAGDYRGARLHRGRGHAFATRDGVLLVSRDLDAVREALDRRVSEEVTYDERRVRRQLPEWTGERPVLRAIADAAGAVATLGPRAREVPWLAAFERLGAIVRVRDGAVVATLRLGTAGAEVVERDVPIPPGARSPRALPGDGLSVRDAAHVAGALDGMLRAAFPLERLRADAVLASLAAGRRGVDLGAEVVARLHGPATLIAGDRRWALRIAASRPRALRRALDRLEGRLPAALRRVDRRLRVERGPMVAVRRGRRLVVRFGMEGDALVLGRASTTVLRSLARTRPQRVRSARGGLSLSLSGADARGVLELLSPRAAALWPGWRLDGWLRAGPERVTGELRAAP